MVRRLAFGLFAPLAGLTVDGSGGLSAGLYLCGALGLGGALWIAIHFVRLRAADGLAGLEEEAARADDEDRPLAATG